MLTLAATFGPAAAQRGDELQQMRQGFTERNEATLAEPYRGITAGAPEPNLFPIRATGVSTEPVRRTSESVSIPPKTFPAMPNRFGTATHSLASGLPFRAAMSPSVRAL